MVDGFNLYHSLLEAQRQLGGQTTRWLNLQSLLTSYLSAIGGGATIQEIHYFSAFAHHMEPARPGTVARHQTYLKCLRDTGVIDRLATFKQKPTRCSLCSGKFMKHEEKETDVAISARLFELLIQDGCDTAVIVTGDTDLAPAIKTAQAIFSGKSIWVGFPYNRKNAHLASLVPKRSFKMTTKHYLSHQFPDPYVLQDGRSVSKPSSW